MRSITLKVRSFDELKADMERDNFMNAQDALRLRSC